MDIRRITTLAIEIVKTVNELNPLFMKTIFKTKTNAIIRSFDLKIAIMKSTVVNVSWH